MPVYRDIFAGPARNYSQDRDGDPVIIRKLWITIHCTANNAPAKGEASYARRRTDDVSSHYYADDRDLLQALNTDWRAWHAGSDEGNDHGISYEITGLPTWSRATWLRNVAWDLLAAQIRRDMAAHDIPARDLTPSDLRARQPGITTHNELRLAFGGTDHTCPGPHFPMDHLISLLEDDMAIDDSDVSRIWNRDGIVRAPAGYEDSDNTHWSPSSILRSAQQYARRGSATASTLLAEQRASFAALSAAVAGRDIVPVVRETIREEFAALAPALAEHLDGVSADQIVEALTRLRLVADES